jgi:filamentous hemagglutinin
VYPTPEPHGFDPGASALKLADVANQVIIDARKLTSYALNPDSPKGKYKAVLFDKLLGFNRENYVDLIRRLETKSLQADICFHSEDKFGKRYTADIPIEGVKGQTVIVRTGWLVSSTDQAHLITLHVRKR